MSVRKKQKFQPFRWVTTPYRLVVIDEESMDEVASYRLKKWSLYIILSSLMVVTALLTLLLIFFTPLCYYLPGYESNATRKEVLSLQRFSDSIGHALDLQQQQFHNLALVLQGDFQEGVRDTNLIDMDALRNEKLKSYFPSVDTIKENAIENLKDNQKASDAPITVPEPKAPAAEPMPIIRR